MVYCVAVNCRSENNRAKNGERVSFHHFPKAKGLRKIWEQKVNRKNWSVDRRSEQAAVLCGLHFEPNQYMINPVVARSIGYNVTQLRLKPGAIPTIFDYGRKQSTSTEASAVKKRRYNVERKERIRKELIDELMKETGPATSCDTNTDSKTDSTAVEATTEQKENDATHTPTASSLSTLAMVAASMPSTSYLPKLDKKIGVSLSPLTRTRTTQTVNKTTAKDMATQTSPASPLFPYIPPSMTADASPPHQRPKNCECCCTCWSSTPKSKKTPVYNTKSGRTIRRTKAYNV